MGKPQIVIGLPVALFRRLFQKRQTLLPQRRCARERPEPCLLQRKRVLRAFRRRDLRLLPGQDLHPLLLGELSLMAQCPQRRKRISLPGLPHCLYGSALCQSGIILLDERQEIPCAVLMVGQGLPETGRRVPDAACQISFNSVYEIHIVSFSSAISLL